ncbi:MAG: glycosyltransferase [Rhodocyclales bacterium GT-UBC]|nr:MAG: glycosyltransferase [Rhodocyclales bacterium GT-UBC]
MPLHSNRPRVAVVYHYWAHYREPIARALCESRSPAPEYTLVSGTELETQDSSAIVTIDPRLAETPVGLGGLRWRFLRNSWFRGLLLWQHGLCRVAASKEFDVVVFLGSMYFVSTWVAALVARCTNKKVLMWSHGFLRREPGVKGLLRRAFYRLADGMLLYGHRARDIMTEYGFRSDRLHVIFNSLDYDKQRAIRDGASDTEARRVRATCFAFPERPVLFFIGRMTGRKRIDQLLEAMALLRLQGHHLNLLLIGGGPAESTLRTQAAALGLTGSVHFVGPSYDELTTGHWIMAGDVCVSPGEVGLSAIHAMAYGKPVITHDNLDLQGPEVESVVENETGSLFRAGSVEDLASAVRRWTSNDQYVAAKDSCIRIVEQRYCPAVQAGLIHRAVLGSLAE